MSGATGGGSETEQRTAYTGTKLETADTAKNVLKPPRYPSTQVNDHVNEGHRLDPKPKKKAPQGDDGCVVSKGLLVPGSEPTGLLQQVERALDLRPCLVQLAIVFRRIRPRRRGRDDCRAMLLIEQFAKRVAAVSLVAQQAARTGLLDQLWRRHDIVAISLGDAERER